MTTSGLSGDCAPSQSFSAVITVFIGMIIAGERYILLEFCGSRGRVVTAFMAT